jgi:hypothetical protein
VAPEL